MRNDKERSHQPSPISIFREAQIKSVILFSAGYLYQGGIWSTNSTDKNRFNFRSNLDADILKNLKLSVGVGAVINSLNYPRSASYEIARKMKDMAPNIPVKWPGR